MLAVQGPAAMAALGLVFSKAGFEVGARLEGVPARHCVELHWRGATVLLARTGYTGEDGMECILDAITGALLWDALLEAGVQPAGLAARDTLRLEAALPLHGNDIDETTNPYEAGLGFAVTLDVGADFTGRAALERLSADGPSRQLACVRLLERGVPRPHMDVLDEAGATVSTLTSGTFSPTLRVGIGMAYLPVGLTTPGQPLQVRVRDRALPAEVVKRPFYRRPRTRSRSTS
jgi:aminomethyltransferase